VMELADSAQIIVSASVYERLRAREKYMAKFREFWTEVKHGEPLSCFQYVDEKIECLNRDIPKVFQKKNEVTTIPKLTEHVASYMALCNKHKAELIEIMPESGGIAYVAQIVLWFMAKDYIEAKASRGFTKPHVKTLGTEK